MIHTVGPVWNGGSKGEEQLLANAYLNSLTLAAENNLRSIAFPNISTGIYHFPKDKAAAIAVSTVRSFLENNEVVEQVIFVCFDDENLLLYKKLLGE